MPERSHALLFVGLRKHDSVSILSENVFGERGVAWRGCRYGAPESELGSEGGLYDSDHVESQAAGLSAGVFMNHQKPAIRSVAARSYVGHANAHRRRICRGE